MCGRAAAEGFDPTLLHAIRRQIDFEPLFEQVHGSFECTDLKALLSVCRNLVGVRRAYECRRVYVCARRLTDREIVRGRER